MPGTVRGERRPREVELDSGVKLDDGVNGFATGRPLPGRGSPEKLRSGRANAGGLAGVDGMVESSVYLGTSTQLVVRLPDGVRMTVLVPNADEAERQRLPGGGAPRQGERGARSTCTSCANRAPDERGAVSKIARDEGGGIDARARAGGSRSRALARGARDRRLRRRRRRGGRRRQGGQSRRRGRDGEGEVHDLELARLRRPRRERHRRRVRGADRRHAEVHRGRQRQRHLLQQAEAAARPGQLRRSQPLRGHRLDGEADVRPRLSAGAQPRRPADGLREHPPAVRGVGRPTPSGSSRSRGRVARPGSGSTRTRPRRSTRSRTSSIRSTRAR